MKDPHINNLVLYFAMCENLTYMSHSTDRMRALDMAKNRAKLVGKAYLCCLREKKIWIVAEVFSDGTTTEGAPRLMQ